MANKSLTEYWRIWISELIWGHNPTELSWLKRLGLRQIQTVALVISDFAANQTLLRAAALTYYSMLSLVPLLALTFALLKAFGVQNLLQPLILEKLNVGNGHIADAILGYINNTQVAQLGAFGLVFLLLAVVSLLTNIEKSFNHVWGVPSVRPFLRRFSDYLSVILVGPVLVISAISMTSSLASNRVVQTLMEMHMVGTLVLTLFKIIPFVFMWLAFSGLYIFMSNTRVDWRAALAGGIVGGTLWQLAQVGYVHFQVGVGRYNAIYGTMAALPIFMVWVYLSWVIVLFGLGICYAKQNLRTSGRDLRRSEVSRNSYEEIALAMMVTLAERFQNGQGAMGQEQLASFIFAPPRLCRSILKSLVKLGFVAELQSKSGRSLYQLGRAADSLTLQQFYQDMRHYGKEVRHLSQHPQVQVALQSYLELETVIAENLGTLNLKDLVEKSSKLGTEGTILLCDQSRSGE